LYQVECDGYVVHKGNDLNSRNHIVSGVMKSELNRAGTFSFTVLPDNIAHKQGKIKVLKSIIKVYRVTLAKKESPTDPDLVKKKTLIWKGRVIDTQRDFYNRVTYNCEGWLGVLNDTILTPVINHYASYVVTDIGQVVDTDNNSSSSSGSSGSGSSSDSGDLSDGSGSSGSSSGGDELSDGSSGGDSTVYDGTINVIKNTVNKILKYIIDQHNANIDDPNKKITLHTFKYSRSGEIHYFPDFSFDTSLDYIMSNIINNEKIGGRIMMKDSDLYYYPSDQSYNEYEGTIDPESTSMDDETYAKIYKTCTQAIEFGKNLLDLNESVDVSGLCSCVYAQGPNNEYVIVEDKSLIKKYGKIYGHVDFSSNIGDTNESLSNAKRLKQMGEAYLKVNKYVSPVIQITALDLSVASTKIDSIKAGMNVVLNSEPHKISANYICTSTEIDICNPVNSKITLGGSALRITDNRNGTYKDKWTRVVNGKVASGGVITFVTAKGG